jgi:hypothetical protein
MGYDDDDDDEDLEAELLALQGMAAPPKQKRSPKKSGQNGKYLLNHLAHSTLDLSRRHHQHTFSERLKTTLYSIQS